MTTALPPSVWEKAVQAGTAAGVSFAFLPSLTELLRDQLVALAPCGDEREVSNDKGTDTARECHVLVVEQSGGWRDLGVRDVYWRVVLAALRENTSEEIPWYSGRLRKMGGGRGYMEIRPCTPEEMYMIVDAITALKAST